MDSEDPRKKMKSIVVLTIIAIVLLIAIILKLLVKISIIKKRAEYIENTDLWHKLAITDDLTGIHNRNAFNFQIDKIRNSKGVKKEPRGIILFDVDELKKINDTKGHLAGDTVLKAAAEILTEVYPEPQYRVFRIGGDEFSVLTEGVSEKEIIESLLTLKKRLNFYGSISLSKGYSMIKNNPEQAFKYADEMLYADKLSQKMRRLFVKDISDLESR